MLLAVLGVHFGDVPSMFVVTAVIVHVELSPKTLGSMM